jgi:hypothetical protein
MRRDMMKRDMEGRDMMERDMMERDRSPGSNHDSRLTILALVFVAAAALGGCGVETATTAATGASIKKQEVEEGKRTQQRADQRIDQMKGQMQQRADQAAGSEK